MGNGKAKGGQARAQALTSERRKEIARLAAESRWAGDAPKALFDGSISIGGTDIPAAVLPDGRRVLTQCAFLVAIGRSRTPKAGTGVLKSEVDELPFFLRADALKPFINSELAESTKPIHYLSKEGIRRVGYGAELLPITCEIYLKYRDACAKDGSKINARLAHLITACDMVMRGLAHVGIVALIDEATGYQEVRDRHALQAILDKFLSKELAAWAKRFPDSFYREMFRLKGWNFDPASLSKPGVVGHYTNDLVYQRLAPGILNELQERNPVTNTGRRKHKHHQWLSEDVGHDALRDHLNIVVAFMQASNDWESFRLMLDKVKPKMGETIQMNF